MVQPGRNKGRRRGFALLEAAVIVAVGGALLALLLLAGGDTRRQARLGEDIAKLRQVGAWTTAYAADSGDIFWSFSWKKGQSLSQYPDLNNAGSDLQAAANQAVDILRRVAGREDIFPINGWIPHLQYNHLVLEDYLQAKVPDRLFVSSMDKHRLKWSSEPKAFDQGLFQPAPSAPNSPGTNGGKRWPYSASFQMPTCFYDGSTFANRVSHAATHSTYSVPPGCVLAARPVSDAAYPSGKVLYHDAHGRHFGKRVPYSSLPEARLPLLFADGGVIIRATADSNTGWHPNQPTTTTPMAFTYQPDLWEPATMNGQPAEAIPSGRFRWTRGAVTEHGIAGRDFDAPETCSGQPGCP